MGEISLTEESAKAFVSEKIASDCIFVSSMNLKSYLTPKTSEPYLGCMPLELNQKVSREGLQLLWLWKLGHEGLWILDKGSLSPCPWT